MKKRKHTRENMLCRHVCRCGCGCACRRPVKIVSKQSKTNGNIPVHVIALWWYICCCWLMLVREMEVSIISDASVGVVGMRVNIDGVWLVGEWGWGKQWDLVKFCEATLCNMYCNLLCVKSGSTPVGGLVKSRRRRTKEGSRGLDKRLVRLELVTAWIQRLRTTSVDPLRRFQSRGEDRDRDRDGQEQE